MKAHDEQMILSNAIKKYGVLNQLIVAIEELSELTKELTEYLRGNTGIVNREHIAEEMADMGIMIEQLRIIFNNQADVDEWEAIKLKRLDERLKRSDENGKVD